ncbi:HAD hydrolase family protein [Methanobrevibacter sp.]
MTNKVYITDCEGPLTLNDNAFEMCSHFIKDGEELYKILSSFDDYLVEVEKREGYHVGGTLAFITPFFKAAGIKNQDLIDYSKDNINAVNGIENVFFLSNNFIDSYIVSTSYSQYIQALCDKYEFSFENTYKTNVDLDEYEITEDEKEKIEEFRVKILECKSIIDFRDNEGSKQLKEDFNTLDDIFFNQMKNLNSYKIMDKINPVGGLEKENSVKDIVSKTNVDLSNVMYVGDSITDLEPLRYVKSNGGLAISFNGNKYAVENADIAIITEDAIAFAVILDLFGRLGKYYTLGFIDQYEYLPEGMYEGFRISHKFLDYFKEHFDGKQYPIIAKITDENREELIKKSTQMRHKIRGDDIASIM